jgi:hypothetical protein
MISAILGFAIGWLFGRSGKHDDLIKRLVKEIAKDGEDKS